MQSLKTFFTPKRRLWTIVAVILMALLVPPVRISLTARALLTDLSQAKAIAADPAARAADLPPLVHQTYTDLATLDARLSPFYGLMRGLRGLPGIGGDIAAVPELLPMGVLLADAGDTVVAVMSPIIPQALNRTGSADDILAAVAETVAQNPAAFTQAAEKVDAALAYRAKVDAATLSPALAKQVNRLDLGSPLLKMGLALAPVAPDLLGFNSPKTYMMLAQNNDEMRATGGFISAVGLLTLDGGKIGELTIGDSYAVDDFSREYPPAPEPLKQIMSAYIWVFRDGNWSPDFPTAAQDLLRLYAISRDTQIDGVIAVDQLALQEIVSVLAPVQVPGFDEPATGENVIELIRKSWSPNDPNFKGWDADWYKNRKNFMGDLVSALRQRVERDPASVDWEQLVDAFLTVMNERHVQIWLTNPAAQAVIGAQGWDGAVQSPAGDFLMPVESNVGFNKMSAVVETSFTYQVDLTAQNTITATLTLTHTNPVFSGGECNPKPHYGKDYWDMMDRCYWNYERVYVPAGSVLIAATPHVVAGGNLLAGQDMPAQMYPLTDVAGKSGWGTLVFAPRGETIVTTARYRLPMTVLSSAGDRRQYRLTVQKQAGMAGISGQVTVILPSEAQVTSVTPAAVISGNRIVFPVKLTQDRAFEVVFQ